MRSASAFASLFVATLLGLGTFACAKDEDRPPVIAACGEGAGCTPIDVKGGGAPSPGGSAGNGGVSDAGAGTLLGAVVAYTSDDFTATQAFTQRATVRGYGPGGTRVSAAWNGVDPFVLSGLELTTENWISVVPIEPAGDFLGTLQPIATDVAAQVNLPVVPGIVLDQIFTVLTLPIDRSATRGHAVLFFQDASRKGVTGIRVQQPQSETVAYADNGWTDDAAATTSAEGLVLLGNIQADTDPGSLRTVTVSGTVSGSFVIRVAQSSVTVAEIRLAP